MARLAWWALNFGRFCLLWVHISWPRGHMDLIFRIYDFSIYINKSWKYEKLVTWKIQSPIFWVIWCGMTLTKNFELCHIHGHIQNQRYHGHDHCSWPGNIGVHCHGHIQRNYWQPFHFYSHNDEYQNLIAQI